MKSKSQPMAITSIITITQFRRHISAYANLLLTGKSFSITKYGKVAAEAIPASQDFEKVFAARLLTRI
ncbi:MAG: hypothetical protein AAB508_03000 [Patescibacteria group bacterium]